MGTAAETQAALDAGSTGKVIQITKEVVNASTTDFYCTGGVTAPGKARWTSVTTASSDATNAAAITANMAL